MEQGGMNGSLKSREVAAGHRLALRLIRAAAITYNQLEANRDVWIGRAWGVLRNSLPLPVPELTLSGPDPFQFRLRPKTRT